MKQKLIAYWSSLPSWVKTSIILFAGAASGVIRHAFLASNGCLTEHCILEYVYAGAHVGGVAVGAYLLKSPLGQKLIPPQS
jgi:hypothetical protein